MPVRAYEAWSPGAKAQSIIAVAVAICQEYGAQGYDLTLRQLYYQFVARDLLPNRQQSYAQLGSIINKARMAGMMDWSYIVDRTRSKKGTSHWSDPADVIEAAARSYRTDKWWDQPARVEIWVEKEALAGVIERSAAEHDVDWFACRGYVSQSEQWAASQRFLGYLQAHQRVVILHLGDHDPSGIDMTRDIRDRLTTFVYSDWHRAHRAELGSETSYRAIEKNMASWGIDFGDSGQPLEVRRIALTYDQVQSYDPPPNPAKMTDSRSAGYVDLYGDESWELDALNPTVLAELITEHIDSIKDADLFEVQEQQEHDERETLQTIADSYDQVAQVFGR